MHHHKPAILLFTVVSVLLGPARVMADPLLGSRIGGLELIGPASPHPASMSHNPATLGLLPGTHLLLSGTARIRTGSVRRAAIDLETGEPGVGPNTRTFEPDSFTRTRPQGYFAATSDIGSDSLVVGLAVNNTWDTTSYLNDPDGELFDPAAQGPNRYHGTDLTFVHLFITPAVAIRLARGWYAGLGLTYMHSTVDFGFVRDVALEGGSTRDPGEIAAIDDCGAGAPCNYESHAAAEAVRVAGNGDALSFHGGIVGRLHPRVDLGIGYTSAAVGLSSERISAGGDAWVRRASVAGESRDLKGRGTVIYQLPHRIAGGLTWRTTSRLTLNLQVRVMLYGSHNELDVRLGGAELRDKPQLPARIIHYRGFQSSVATQLGTSIKLTPRLVLQAASMLRSSSVGRDALTGVSIDGWTFDSFVALRWNVVAGMHLQAGYGLALMPSVTVNDSSFHPSSFVNCVDGDFDIETPACKDTSAGRGLASSAGSYAAATHHLATTISYSWR